MRKDVIIVSAADLLGDFQQQIETQILLNNAPDVQTPELGTSTAPDPQAADGDATATDPIAPTTNATNPASNPGVSSGVNVVAQIDLMTGEHDPRVIELRDQLRAIGRETEEAYEAGDHARAEDLEAQFAEMAEMLEAMAHELESDPGEEFAHSTGGDPMSDLTGTLARLYHEYENPHAHGPNPEDLVQIARNAIRDAGGDDSLQADDDIVDAMKDAYDRVQQLHNRTKPDTGDAQLIRIGAADVAPLVAVHQLNERNLLHAAEVGGLMAPSLAVMRPEHEFARFGEITLVAPLSMVDPEETPVFDADIYSPRYPQVWNKMLRKEQDAFHKSITPYAERSDTHLSDLWHRTEWREGAEGLVHTARPALQLKFLEEVKGASVPDMMRQVPLNPEWVSAPSLQTFFQQQGRSEADPQPGSPYWAALSQAAQVGMREYFADLFQDDAEMAQDVIEAQAEYYFDESGQLSWGTYEKLRRAAGNVGKQQVDRYAFHDRLNELIEPHAAEFKAWAEGEVGGMLGDRFLYTEGGARRKYSPENVLKQMTPKNLRGGENFDYGLGSTRALGAKKFRSMSQMEASADTLVSEEEFKAYKEAQDTEFEELAERLAPYHVREQGRGASNDLRSAIGESYKRGRSLFSELRNSGFGGMPRELLAEVSQFAQDLRTSPTQYFEAKPRRVVELREFVGAAVPEDIGPQALGVLEEAGLRIVRYQDGGSAAAVTSLAGMAREAGAAEPIEVTAAGIIDVNGVAHQIASLVAEAMAAEAKDWRNSPQDVANAGYRAAEAAGFQGATLFDFFGKEFLQNKKANYLFGDTRLHFSAATYRQRGRTPYGTFTPDVTDPAIALYLINAYVEADVRAEETASPLAENLEQLLRNTLAHEIRHAADWAYQTAADPDQFRGRNTGPQVGDIYMVIAEELGPFSSDDFVEVASVGRGGVTLKHKWKNMPTVTLPASEIEALQNEVPAALQQSSAGDALTRYINKPTELLSWAGSIAEWVWSKYKSDWRSLGGDGLTQFVAATEQYKRIRPEQRPAFLQRVVRALEQLEKLFAQQPAEVQLTDMPNEQLELFERAGATDDRQLDMFDDEHELVTVPGGSPLFGNSQPTTYALHGVGENTVTIGLAGHKGFGARYPKESLSHFVSDMSGRTPDDMTPDSGNESVDAVIRGQGELLGKGDDGVVWRVGDMVVKMSTVVPYQPLNGGRTPDQAAQQMREQSQVAEELGGQLPSVQVPVTVEHGDKVFQVRPYVEIPEQFTREELEYVSAQLDALHSLGFRMGDELQVGRQADGQLVFFDIGKAAPGEKPFDEYQSYFDPREDDESALRRFYQQHETPYAPSGSFFDRAWARVLEYADPEHAWALPFESTMKTVERARELGRPEADDVAKVLTDFRAKEQAKKRDTDTDTDTDREAAVIVVAFKDVEVGDANSTCRETGIIGTPLKPLVYKKLLELGKDRAGTVLDFGAGRGAVHSKALKSKGWPVTAWEFGGNFDRALHDKRALDRKYDTVVASNVLNVQQSKGMLRETLEQLTSAVKPGGTLICNMPKEPRHHDVPAEEVERLLGRAGFEVEESKGGSAPVWVFTRGDARSAAINGGGTWWTGSPVAGIEQFKTTTRPHTSYEPVEVPMFLTRDKEFARAHAVGPEGTLYQVALTPGLNLFDSDDLWLGDSQYWPPEDEALTPLGVQLRDALEDGLFPDGDDDGGYLEAALNANWDFMESNQMMGWLREQGFQGFRILGDHGPETTSIAVFDPSHLQIVGQESGHADSDDDGTSVKVGGTRSAAGLIDVNPLVDEIAEPFAEAITYVAKQFKGEAPEDLSQGAQVVLEHYSNQTEIPLWTSGRVSLDAFDNSEILSVPEAQAWFDKTTVTFWISGDTSFTADRWGDGDQTSPHIEINFGQPMFLAVHGKDPLPLLKELLTHEIRHAGDWAYRKAAGVSQEFDIGNKQMTGPDATEEELEEYFNQPTELLSYAGNFADRLWAELGEGWRQRSGGELVELLRRYYPKTMRRIRADNVNDFLSRVVKGLEQLELQHAPLEITAAEVARDEADLAFVISAAGDPWRAGEEEQRRLRADAMEEYRLPNVFGPEGVIPASMRFQVAWDGSDTVTIYRAIRGDVPPDQAVIRPGDWVALDRSYVDLHGGLEEGGQAQIAELVVPADHVAWAGTDLNEWFYAPRAARTAQVDGSEVPDDADEPIADEADLAYLAGEPGTLPQIGEEKPGQLPWSAETGERATTGIVRHVSPQGSYRYVYMMDGQAVSALQVMKNPRAKKWIGHIANVWTDPAYRRQGLAEALLVRAREDFDEVRHSAHDLTSAGAGWKSKVGSAELPLAGMSDEELEALATAIQQEITIADAAPARTAASPFDDRFKQFLANRSRRELAQLLMEVQRELGNRAQYAARPALDLRVPAKLRDVATLRLGQDTADFWLQRNGTTESVGRPSDRAVKDWFAVTVTRPDLITPEELKAQLWQLWERRYLTQFALGTLQLQHIRKDDLMRLPIKVRAARTAGFDWEAGVRQIPVGKVLPDAVYLHKSALKEVPDVVRRRIESGLAKATGSDKVRARRVRGYGPRDLWVDPQGVEHSLEGMTHPQWAVERAGVSAGTDEESPAWELLRAGWLRVSWGSGVEVQTLDATTARRVKSLLRRMASDSVDGMLYVDASNPAKSLALPVVGGRIMGTDLAKIAQAAGGVLSRASGRIAAWDAPPLMLDAAESWFANWASPSEVIWPDFQDWPLAERLGLTENQAPPIRLVRGTDWEKRFDAEFDYDEEPTITVGRDANPSVLRHELQHYIQWVAQEALGVPAGMPSGGARPYEEDAEPSYDYDEHDNIGSEDWELYLSSPEEFWPQVEDDLKKFTQSYPGRSAEDYRYWTHAATPPPTSGPRPARHRSEFMGVLKARQPDWWQRAIKFGLTRTARAAAKLPEWNVLKLNRKEPKASLLWYPGFDSEPYPALASSVGIDLGSGALGKARDYSSSENPPILHRKEEMLGAKDKRREAWREMAVEAEEAGLYEDTSRIGFKRNWEELIADKGLKLTEEGRLVTASGAIEVTAAWVILADRMDFLREKYPEGVTGPGTAAPITVDQLAAFDPTRNKAYLQWLIKQVTVGLPMDLRRVTALLERYERGKRSRLMPREYSDINQLTVAQLTDAVEAAEDAWATREHEKYLRDQETLAQRREEQQLERQRQLEEKHTLELGEKGEGRKLVGESGGFRFFHVPDRETMVEEGDKAGDNWCVGWERTDAHWDAYMEEERYGPNPQLFVIENPEFKESPWLLFKSDTSGELADRGDGHSDQKNEQHPIHKAIQKVVGGVAFSAAQTEQERLRERAYESEDPRELQFLSRFPDLRYALGRNPKTPGNVLARFVDLHRQSLDADDHGTLTPFPNIELIEHPNLPAATLLDIMDPTLGAFATLKNTHTHMFDVARGHALKRADTREAALQETLDRMEHPLRRQHQEDLLRDILVRTPEVPEWAVDEVWRRFQLPEDARGSLASLGASAVYAFAEHPNLGAERIVELWDATEPSIIQNGLAARILENPSTSEELIREAYDTRVAAGDIQGTLRLLSRNPRIPDDVLNEGLAYYVSNPGAHDTYEYAAMLRQRAVRDRMQPDDFLDRLLFGRRGVEVAYDHVPTHLAEVMTAADDDPEETWLDGDAEEYLDDYMQRRGLMLSDGLRGDSLIVDPKNHPARSDKTATIIRAPRHGLDQDAARRKGFTLKAEDEDAKARFMWGDLVIAIEHTGGDVRHPGSEFAQALPADWIGYGYLEGMPAVDGDSLDVIVGGDGDQSVGYLAVQSTPEGEFQQFKVMLNFADEARAEAGFLAMWPETMFMGLTPIELDDLREIILPRLVVDDDESPPETVEAPTTPQSLEPSTPPPEDAMRVRVSPFYSQVGDAPRIAKSVVGDTCPHCGDTMSERSIFGQEGRWFHRSCTDKGPVGSGSPVVDDGGDGAAEVRTAFTGSQREWRAGEKARHASGETVKVIKKQEREGGISVYQVEFTSGPRAGERVIATPSALLDKVGARIVITAEEFGGEIEDAEDTEDAEELEDIELEMSPALHQLYAKGQQIFSAAVTAGAQEVAPGVVSLGRYGELYHPREWATFSDETKVESQLADMQRRLERYEAQAGDGTIVIGAADVVGAGSARTALRVRRRKKNPEKKKRFFKRTWYLREGTNVAYSADRGISPTDQEITLKPNSKVLELSESQIKRTAAVSSDAEALARAVEQQAEAIKSLTALVEKLLAANTGGYDAVQTEDRLIVLNPKALETTPKRKRWLEHGRRAAP